MSKHDTPSQTAQSFYERNFAWLSDAALSAPGILLADAERLPRTVAARLHEFHGETDTEFQAWAQKIIDGLVAFYALRAEHGELVEHAIREGLKYHIEPDWLGKYDSVVDDLSNDVWMWVHRQIDKITKAGTAKTSTRLWALGKRFGVNWRRNQLKRLYAGTKHLRNGKGFDCETLPYAERFSENNSLETRFSDSI